MLAPSQSKRACRVCGDAYLPFSTTQIVCGVACARKVPVIARKKARADKKATRERIEQLRPLGYWIKQAQHEINRYVRIRDARLPCVSCPRPADWDGQWHASHFRSTGAAPQLRFHLWNIHKACSICNNWKSGNLSEYETNLRNRIGAAKVDWLRAQTVGPRMSREYLQRLATVFRKRCRRLEKRL